MKVGISSTEVVVGFPPGFECYSGKGFGFYETFWKDTYHTSSAYNTKNLTIGIQYKEINVIHLFSINIFAQKGPTRCANLLTSVFGK